MTGEIVFNPPTLLPFSTFKLFVNNKLYSISHIIYISKFYKKKILRWNVYS